MQMKFERSLEKQATFKCNAVLHIDKTKIAKTIFHTYNKQGKLSNNFTVSSKTAEIYELGVALHEI